MLEITQVPNAVLNLKCKIENKTSKEIEARFHIPNQNVGIPPCQSVISSKPNPFSVECEVFSDLQNWQWDAAFSSGTKIFGNLTSIVAKT